MLLLLSVSCAMRTLWWIRGWQRYVTGGGAQLTSCVDMSHCFDLSDGIAALGGLSDNASGII